LKIFSELRTASHGGLPSRRGSIGRYSLRESSAHRQQEKYTGTEDSCERCTRDPLFHNEINITRFLDLSTKIKLFFPALVLPGFF